MSLSCGWCRWEVKSAIWPGIDSALPLKQCHCSSGNLSAKCWVYRTRDDIYGTPKRSFSLFWLVTPVALRPVIGPHRPWPPAAWAYWHTLKGSGNYLLMLSTLSLSITETFFTSVTLHSEKTKILWWTVRCFISTNRTPDTKLCNALKYEHIQLQSSDLHDTLYYSPT